MHAAPHARVDLAGQADFELKADVLLVNMKSLEVPFIIKNHSIVLIGGKKFLRGTYAKIGDEERDAGLVVNLSIDDTTAIREFSWQQAKEYYGSTYHEGK